MTAHAPIYVGGATLETGDKVAQIQKLALVGIASLDSNMNLLHLDEALQGLFEVIHRLSGEVQREVEEVIGRPPLAPRPVY